MNDELTDEFRAEFEQSYLTIETTLVSLERSPADSELLNLVFREVHTIKGNLQFLHMDTIAEFVHIIESILEDIRGGTMVFDSNISDIVLLAVDRVRDHCEYIFTEQPVNTKELPSFSQALDRLRRCAPGKLSRASQEVIQLLESPARSIELSETASDLVSIKAMADFIERRILGWVGRSERLRSMVLTLNRESNRPVDELQLEAAVYMHDMAMGFVGAGILNKSGKLTTEDRKAVTNHSRAAAEFLRALGGWESAAKMVLQHHEREDGKGYPDGLVGSGICDGAKIIAIADTFESMTQERSFRERKRPLLRVIAEINGCSGTQFAPDWVEVFNAIVRARYSTKNIKTLVS